MAYVLSDKSHRVDTDSFLQDLGTFHTQLRFSLVCGDFLRFVRILDYGTSPLVAHNPVRRSGSGATHAVDIRR